MLTAHELEDLQVEGRASTEAREHRRARWRAFLAPRWRRLASEVLTADEARVLSLRLGLMNDVGMTHAAIGRRLHKTTNTIGRIERRGLEKVRAALRGGTE